MMTATDKDEASAGAGGAGAHRSVDAARVAALRARIAAGDYVVDPEAIADRLVDGGFPDSAVPGSKDQNDAKLAGDIAM